MKTVTIVLIVAGLFYTRSYFVVSDSVQAEIQAYNQANKICRDSDINSGKLSCDQRDKITKLLIEHRMCWGHQSQAEYEKTWIPCGQVAVDIFFDKFRK